MAVVVELRLSGDVHCFDVGKSEVPYVDRLRSCGLIVQDEYVRQGRAVHGLLRTSACVALNRDEKGPG